jgi:isoleucyl-tRNA synthetase
MTVMAPVLPYLAEEIHSTLHEGDEGVSQLSVFTTKWAPVVSVNVGTARFFLTFSLTA